MTSLLIRTLQGELKKQIVDTRSDLEGIFKNLEYYSIAIGETTYMTDTCQLVVFVKLGGGLTTPFDIVQEFVQFLSRTLTLEQIFLKA